MLKVIVISCSVSTCVTKFRVHTTHADADKCHWFAVVAAELSVKRVDGDGVLLYHNFNFFLFLFYLLKGFFSSFDFCFVRLSVYLLDVRDFTKEKKKRTEKKKCFAQAAAFRMCLCVCSVLPSLRAFVRSENIRS